MNKTILLIAISIILVSCEDVNIKKASDKDKISLDTTAEFSDQNYSVYRLNNCEYIVYGSGNNRWGSHRGDCKNPIHNKSEDKNSFPYDSSIYQEKHFDCYVEEIMEEENGKYKYWVYTECGIVFLTNRKYKIGEKLKGFKSPKHK